MTGPVVFGNSRQRQPIKPRKGNYVAKFASRDAAVRQDERPGRDVGSGFGYRAMRAPAAWPAKTWPAAVGDGHQGATPIIIEAKLRSSNTVTVAVPDDNIAHGCNKLIVNLRSLQPDKYKIAPCINGKGFVYVPCVDNDGGHPGGTLSEYCR